MCLYRRMVYQCGVIHDTKIRECGAFQWGITRPCPLRDIESEWMHPYLECPECESKNDDGAKKKDTTHDKKKHKKKKGDGKTQKGKSKEPKNDDEPPQENAAEGQVQGTEE